MKGKYRKDIRDYSFDGTGRDYVSVEDAMIVIGDIEDDVNEIKNKLEPYIVFTELDDIYNMLDKLSDKLY
jgi:hypothetical protein